MTAAAVTTAQHSPSQETQIIVTATAMALHGQQADADAAELHGHQTDVDVTAAVTNCQTA